MCGIAGFLGGNLTADVAQTRILAMTDVMAKRGPDSQGLWLDADMGIALGHRRLSIVDLSSAGHQPMVSGSGRYVIAFNGEIYNYLELSDAPEMTGTSWRGHSDTERFLAGFDVWGIQETVERCKGMFAFAVWDRQARTVTLGRDRLGEKPLYYGWQGSGRDAVFLFGSELKALRAHPAFLAQINRDALCLYMRHNNVPGAHTIYQGVHKLLPGSLLTVSQRPSTSSHQTYWSGARVAELGVLNPFRGEATDAVDSLEVLLKDAIQKQMIADVPMGAFLSGGIDSSTIVALMQVQSSCPVKTFSLGFHDDLYNEAHHAKAVAQHLGTDHTELYVTPEQAMAVISNLPKMFDEPFADSSQIATFLVSNLARQHVTVTLSGDAGDELFAGYNRYQLTSSIWRKLAAVPLPLRRVLSWVLTRLSPQRLNSLAAYMNVEQRWANVGEKMHKGAGVMLALSTEELHRGLVSQWIDPAHVVLGGTEPDTLLTGLRPALVGLNDVQRMMALDMLTYLPDDILTKVDRAAMGASLETRLPFLDHRIVEFAWQLPMQYKLRYENNRFTTKWALRQVLFRHVPQALIEKPKMGFGVPIDSWLRGPLKDWAEDLLDESRLKREGYFNPAPIRQKWAEHLSGRRNWQHQLWCVLMFQTWLTEQKVLQQK